MSKKVVSWCLEVKFDDGKVEKIVDMPNDVSQVIDDWLTEEEEEENPAKCKVCGYVEDWDSTCDCEK